jgi:hypothetical protein
MAFTSNDDLNILQASDSTNVGAGAGNDTYIVTPTTMAAGQTINITDTEGANNIKLVGGVTIASSIVAANSIQLTINNGGIINIFGADTFSYILGGDAFDATSGVSQSFNDFVTASLGATVPTGTDTVNGSTTNETVNEDGTIGTPATPTFALAGAASVDEGATATFTLTTTNVADGTTVNYTISGVSAADVTGGLTGTATVTGNTATISVPVVADTTTEGAETLTVSIDGQTASASTTVNDTSTAPVNTDPTFALAGPASVDEGATATYTLTTTNVAAGTSVAYTITGVDAADVTGGSLTGTATVAADGTASIAVSLVEDSTTEGAETMTVSIDGQAGATAATTVNDTSVLTTIPLTAGADTPTLTTGDDTIDGTTVVDSLNGDDSIVDSSTTDNDTLNVQLTNIIDKSDGTPSDQPTITNIENVNIDWNRIGSATVDLKNVSGSTVTVKSTNADFLGGLTIDNAGSSKVVAGDKVTNVTANNITSGTIDAGSSTTATLSATTSTSDAPTLIVNNNITVTNNVTAGTIVEDLTIQANAASIVTLSGIGSSLKLTGDKDITLKTSANTSAAVALAGETITDATTAGTTTLSLAHNVGALNPDYSKAKVDLIDITVNQTAGTFTFADSANVQISKNQTNALTLQGTSNTDSLSLSTTSAVSSLSAITTVAGDVATSLESILLTLGGNLAITTLTDETSLFKVKGTGDLTIGTNAASAASNINASELSGKLVLSANADLDNDVTVKGGSGANEVATGAIAANNTFTYTGLNGGDTIDTAVVVGKVKATTGTGADTLKTTGVLEAGTVEFNSGAGNDSFKLGNTAATAPTDAAASTSVITFNGGDGTDTFDLSGNTAATVNLLSDTLTFTSVEKIKLNDGAAIGASYDIAKGSLSIDAKHLSGKTYQIEGTASTNDVINVLGTTSADTIDLSTLVPDENVQGFFVDALAGTDTITASAVADVFTIAAQSTSNGIDKIIGFKAGTDKLDVGTASAGFTDLTTSDFSSASNLAGAATAAVAAAVAAAATNYDAASDAVLFVFDSKTYVTINDGANSAFTDGTDILVELSGLSGTMSAADIIV